METTDKLEEHSSKKAGQEIEMELEFTSFYRWHHWIRVLSIIILIATGFYISVPFIIPAVNAQPTNFLNAEFRGLHEIFGFVMISMFIGKTYYFFFAVKDRMEIKSYKDVVSLKNWLSQIGYYLLLTKHPKLSGAYNVIQLLAYLVFYIAITGLIVTGLILYVHSFHLGIGGILYESMRSLEVMFGGLAAVRELHHLLMWGVIFFIVGHVYMVVFNAVYGKEGTVDSIFSGYRWKRNH
ncbi:MAG: Ni/Fe-hydrogenase, b-type cytochrome subunit [Sulfurimonas sp. RIFCSPHIGHO2_12_FULL_36_9]|uniref:Ni/Fe-hydrogenase, b-type cytochrome subunit n=1 Tax=Sulfurimonas sp. RIFCSPLOWO2_12_36_12 TaxID=1802253 RepID=UPI0008D18189|nr:Ni/Fe-hydrogenase, b-type cytochrome subunit [Sulfurimonas sp. RIFCSPLOWO2_12_36_12]OHD98942.1 MAG: Ni/Fe-hydrogenase, b-type cytochrome subunit [Sulfurimonas sp. RIFCSPHIGHO2_12_FULL_36_9]OHE02979.1 MAG: Ni/Fe-hydrogenase, b-type cytochrome subunit [Sulfurimonas sp. RIFCSPLOWO2_12_36_12]